MITGVHAMFYAKDAEGLRAFLRDKLGLPCADAGDGWLIFDLPQSDMGVHPTEAVTPPSGTHHISFLCDDVKKTVAELTGRGVRFTAPISDQGYALATTFEMPGGLTVQLYEPRYRTTMKRVRSASRPARAVKPRKVARKAVAKTKVKAKQARARR